MSQARPHTHIRTRGVQSYESCTAAEPDAVDDDSQAAAVAVVAVAADPGHCQYYHRFHHSSDLAAGFDRYR